MRLLPFFLAIFFVESTGQPAVRWASQSSYRPEGDEEGAVGMPIELRYIRGKNSPSASGGVVTEAGGSDSDVNIMPHSDRVPADLTVTGGYSARPNYPYGSPRDMRLIPEGSIPRMSFAFPPPPPPPPALWSTMGSRASPSTIPASGRNYKPSFVWQSRYDDAELAPAPLSYVPPCVCPSCPASVGPSTITVTSEGKVRVPAEFVEIKVQASQDARTAVEAKAMLDEKLGRVTDQLANGNDTVEWGEKFRVYPGSMSIDKQYHWENNYRVFDGFSARQEIIVELHDIPSLDKLIVTVLDSGDLAEINGIYFRINNPEKYQTLAREQAAHQATAVASDVLRNLDRELGELQSVQIDYAASPLLVPRRENFAISAAVANAAKGTMAELYDGQTIDFSASITATYWIRAHAVPPPDSGRDDSFSDAARRNAVPANVRVAGPSLSDGYLRGVSNTRHTVPPEEIPIAYNGNTAVSLRRVQA